MASISSSEEMTEKEDDPHLWAVTQLSWHAMVVRVSGLVFAAYLIRHGWEFWPIVIAILSLVG